MSPSCAANTSACTSTCRAAPACLGIGARIGLDFGNTAARDALRALLRLVSLADCKTSLSERQKAALADFVLDDAAFSRGLEALCVHSLESAIDRLRAFSLFGELDGFQWKTFPESRALRLSAAARIGALPVVIAIDLFADAEALRNAAPESLILRETPWFVIASSPLPDRDTDEKPEPLSLSVFAGNGTENIMCALSLEDAGKVLRLKTTLDQTTPLRSRGTRRSIYGEAISQPGACTFLSAEGASSAERADALARVLLKGADILERRLDIARASLVEGRRIETRLLKESSL